jgi:hypothetical protein
MVEKVLLIRPSSAAAIQRERRRLLAARGTLPSVRHAAFESASRGSAFTSAA